MGRSQETFSKKEREKKKKKKQNDKEEKREQRKASSSKGKSLEDMMAYVDENGNITSTPPDPKKKRETKAEDIRIDTPAQVEEDPIRTGVVTFFNETKGYGFIKDDKTKEGIFVHIQSLSAPLKEKDKVTFEVVQGDRGLQAANVVLVVT